MASLDVAARLSLRMNELGLSPAALSERLGVHRNQVYYWTSGRRRPRDNGLRRLAEALDTTFEWLAYGGPVAPPTGSVPVEALDRMLGAEEVGAELRDGVLCVAATDGERRYLSIVLPAPIGPWGGGDRLIVDRAARIEQIGSCFHALVGEEDRESEVLRCHRTLERSIELFVLTALDGRSSRVRNPDRLERLHPVVAVLPRWHAGGVEDGS